MAETTLSDDRRGSAAKGQASREGASAELAGVYGILLAGGHAWGEWIIEKVCPRPLLPVAGQPLVRHLLDWLGRSGVRAASICANSDTSIFRRNLESTENGDLLVGYHEDAMPRGPAGCIRDVAADVDSDLFAIVEASVLVDIDLAEVVRSHRMTGAALTVVVEDQNPEASARGWKRRPVGVYVASREAFEMISATGYQDIKEMWIPWLYSKNKTVLTFVAEGAASIRVIDSDSYLAANRWVVERVLEHGQSGEYRRVDDALVHRSVELPASTCLVGPVLIGPDCRIEDEVTLVGPTVVGRGCRLDRLAVVSRSVIWQACHVGRGAILDRSILLDAAAVEPELVVRESILGNTQAASALFLKGLGSYWRTEHSPVADPQSVMNAAMPSMLNVLSECADSKPRLAGPRPPRKAKATGSC